MSVWGKKQNKTKAKQSGILKGMKKMTGKREDVWQRREEKNTLRECEFLQD